MKYFRRKTNVPPPQAQSSAAAVVEILQDGDDHVAEISPNPSSVSSLTEAEETVNTSDRRDWEYGTPSHTVHDLPSPSTELSPQLAIVLPTPDLKFARAMAPPARYQGKVASAQDSEAARDENELNSAIAFASLALEMLEAQDAETPDEGEGSSTSKAKVTNIQNDEARTANRASARGSTPVKSFDQNHGITTLPVLSTSFESPGPVSAVPTVTTNMSMLEAATRIDPQPYTNTRQITARVSMRDANKDPPGQSFRVLSPSDLEEIARLKAQKKRRFHWIKKLF